MEIVALNQTTKSYNVNVGNSVVLSASGLVYSGPAVIKGVFVSASASGTVEVYNNTTAANPLVLSTFSALAGSYYEFGDIRCSNGIYVVLGGTITLSVVYYAHIPLYSEIPYKAT